MEEVWVPTKWHKEVFSQFLQQMGLPAPLIAVVPEAVDTDLFRPDLDLDLDLDLALGLDQEKALQQQQSSSVDVEHCRRLGLRRSRTGRGRGGSCWLDGEGRVRCQGDSSFVFLSIFKWEYRKGWDVLLTAFWTAFSREDRVLLRIRSYRPSSDKAGDTNLTRTIGERRPRPF